VLASAADVEVRTPRVRPRGGLRSIFLEVEPLRVSVCANKRYWICSESTLPVAHIGEVEEIAEAYLYLMRQTYGTGEVLRVDGGGALV
jgi:NAD(P)-dependent dehydrogenase (short-subunit alcohol dehydrogenase family)